MNSSYFVLLFVTILFSGCTVQLHAAQEDFALALENLNRALEFAERRNLAELTQSANHELGDLY